MPISRVGGLHRRGYIKEKITDESATRNIPAFSRFLQTVGFCHGQQLNYANVARETGVSSSTVSEGSDRFGSAFEHFLLNEVRAVLDYRTLEQPLSFWRTSSGFEVDLIVGDMEIAIEFESGRELRGADLKGMRALLEEHTPRRSMVVTRGKRRRKTEDGIEIVPWRDFCIQLWSGELL